MSGVLIDVPTPNGIADCYLATPTTREPRAGVLLIMDAIGLRPRIHEMADRIGARGYVVLAPNVFYRAGRAPLWETPVLTDPESRSRFFDVLGPLRGALTPDAIASDGGAYLSKLWDLIERPVGIAGYCFGGRLGWVIAAAYPDRVAAYGGFHTGGMVTDQPDSPHLLAPKIQAEVYWGHADQDANMTATSIDVLDQAMDDAGVRHTTEVYEGAQHGYTMADMHAYHEAAAERHFAALFSLFERALPL
jgi:carboxymethylenebutenolidase